METDAARILRGYLEAMALSAEQMAERCGISGPSVRLVLDGRPVGAKVAKALAAAVPALTLDMLILPEPPAGKSRAATGDAAA